MTTLLSGDVQDALYSIFTCNGDQGKELLKILGAMDSDQINDTSTLASLLRNAQEYKLDDDNLFLIEALLKKLNI